MNDAGPSGEISHETVSTRGPATPREPGGPSVGPMRRAKIVCTMGPSTVGRLREFVAAGMDVARFNLSHGGYADHEKMYAEVRAASDAVGHAVGVLVDLQGPKIRLGRFA